MNPTFFKRERTNPTLSQWKMWMIPAMMFAMLAGNSAHADCTVAANSVSFGSYDVFSPVSLDGVGQIQVNCDPVGSYSIALSTGAGTYVQRQMSSGASLMYYNLYTNASRTTLWGDGSGGSSTVSGSGVAATHHVYGRIPSGQNLVEGNYSDVIIVTLTY